MLHRLRDAMSPAAMLVAVLALVLAGAGVGYSAGQIGTNDIKNNAVTSAKVKNGTLAASDMKKEKKLTQPTLSNGTEGDCLWQDVAAELPGLAPVGYRVDRFGTTHLSGVVAVSNGPGGDMACGTGGDVAEALDDLTGFRLPKAARPARSLFLPQEFSGSGTILIIPGQGGLEITPGVVIPHGAVLSLGGEATIWLEGISFPTASAKVMPTNKTGLRPLTPRAKQMVKKLFKLPVG